MNNLSFIFQQPSHKALISYITAGFPTIESTKKIASLLARNGADIIELGIPFSDPLADGTTIQKASYKALANGVTPGLCLEMARDISSNSPVPLVFMTYYNPLLSFGIERFCRECLKSNVSGLIVPDLPPEEGVILEKASNKHGIDLIYLIAPNTTPKRIKLATQRSRGFIYLVSVTGLTGARTTLPLNLTSLVKKVKKFTDKPLCVGFGISTVQQAKEIAKITDGIIIGSKLIQLIEQDSSLNKLTNFIGEIRKAL